MDKNGLANLILIHWTEAEKADRQSRLQWAMSQACTLADYGLKLVPSESGGYVAMESDSLVLNESQCQAAREAAADCKAKASPASVYLATRIARTGNQAGSISYAVVAGLADPPSPCPGTGDVRLADPDGVWLNSWAATDLGANVGESLELTYLVPTPQGTYHEKTLRRKLKGVILLSGAADDPQLTPTLEGLTDATRIDEWSAPFPIDLSRVTQRDDAYWERYRATPKAFVSLDTMRDVWGQSSPAGGSDWITSMRMIPVPGTRLADLPQRLTSSLLQRLSPQDSQMAFRPLRKMMLEASKGAGEFGQLFLAMSFFLVISAAALAGAIMRLMVQRRAEEMGMMLACGWRRAAVAGVILGEGLALSAVGVMAGLPLGVLYSRGLLYAMQRWWMSPWDRLTLQMHIDPMTLLYSGASGLAIGMGCALWSMRTSRRRGVLELLSGWQAMAVQNRPGEGRWAGRLLVGVSVLAAGAMGLSAAGKIPPEIGFFSGGSTLLVAGLLLTAVILHRAMRQRHTLSLTSLAVRSAAANRGRSLLTVGLFAAAMFIVMTVAVNRRNLSNLDPADIRSGTGGFTLRFTTSVPLHYDLASIEGRKNLGFSAKDEAAFAGATVMPLLASPGDDVSCLNLAQPQQPRLLGVSRQFINRGGFPVRPANSSLAGNPWNALLEKPDADDAIPAFGDAESVQWKLHVGLGDVLTTPGPSGQPIKLRIAGVISGSIFGGELLVSQENFRRLYPNTQGTSYFLLACDQGKTAALTDALRGALADWGVELRQTREILKSYLDVQNVYLSIFMVLGGLGTLLGTVGMLAVIFRSVFERRSELALMSAVGFGRPVLVRLVVMEFTGLLLAGLVCGSVAAWVATMPVVLGGQSQAQWPHIGALLGGIFILGLVCCMVAANASVSRTPAAALREE